MERIAFRRNQDTVDYSENSDQFVDLHTGRLYRVLHCRLSGSLTIANNAASALLEDAPYSIIKKVEVMLNGNVPVVTMSGKALFEMNMILKRAIPNFTAPGLTIATHPFNAYFQIPFYMPETGNFMDNTIVDATLKGGVNNFTLAVEWGDAEDLVTPVAAVDLTYATEPSLAIVSQEMIRLDSDINKFHLNRRRTITSNVTQTSDSHRVDIKSGPNRAIARILIIARDGGIRASDIINNLRVESDRDVRYTMSELMNQDILDIENEVETSRTGVYLIDLAPGALIGHSAEMSDVSDFSLILDVNGGANHQLEIVVQEIIRAPSDSVG